MADFYAAQRNRALRHDWGAFRDHRYDAYNVAAVGDIVEMPWGDRVKLVYKATGVIYKDSTQDNDTDEEDNLEDVITYVFEDSEDDVTVYHTQVYIGDIIAYDFPDINEYHHEEMLEIDINDYNIGGVYEVTYEYAEGER